MSPPAFWAPQVTTRPSAIAQKADAVDWICWTFINSSWTAVLSPPVSSELWSTQYVVIFLLSSEDNFLWCLENTTWIPMTYGWFKKKPEKNISLILTLWLIMANWHRPVPRSWCPHVTTLPSARIAANEVCVDWICCTSFNSPSMVLLSPPASASPHVITLPSCRIAANAFWVAWIYICSCMR